MQILQTAETKTISESPASCGRELAFLQIKEYLVFDSLICRKLIAALGIVTGVVFSAFRQTSKAFSIFAKIHRAAYSDWASKFVEWWVSVRIRNDFPVNQGLLQVCNAHLDQLSEAPATRRFHADPLRLLGTRVLVLKSPAVNEKGVVLIDYTFAFALFAKSFDVERIAQQYYFVLEPSWSGYCDLDILYYTKFNFPVFVQAPEPKDAALLQNIKCNLVPLPVGDNWWVDHRIYRPVAGVSKDVDVVMVGSWGSYKRHFRFFAALAGLRSKGERLKAVMVGYPGGYTREDIYRHARHYGVHDQVEFHEHLPPEEVNLQYNRAKVNLVWSRREGCNRSSVEGMFAGVPCIFRDGFNYGHQYDHVNTQTGCYASERDLPNRMLWLTKNPQQFCPRAWVLENMSCQRATAILNEAIRRVAIRAGENWTRDLVVKVTYVGAMRYWDEDDAQRFRMDYDFLRSLNRRV
jgi:glycosyltransferase involved in cell wall biosynthesis